MRVTRKSRVRRLMGEPETPLPGAPGITPASVMEIKIKAALRSFDKQVGTLKSNLTAMSTKLCEVAT